jgi:hypothetical protein
MDFSMSNRPLFFCGFLCASAVTLLCGCGKPNAANIELRKQNQQLREQLATAQTEKQGLLDSLHATNTTPPTIRSAVVAPQALDNLFTAHGLSFGRLTGGADLDPTQPGDEGIKVYVVPTDQHGDPIKSAGTFVVEAFNLDRHDDVRVGRWEFDATQTMQAWHGRGLLYTYVLTCPWQSVVESRELTIKIDFVDTLTGRQLSAQRSVKINPPGPTPATTQPRTIALP